MTPQSQPRKPRHSSRASLLIAFGFHAGLVFVILYFAARSGMIGDQLKNLTVSMVRVAPPPQKPKEPDKRPPAEPEPAAKSPPRLVDVATPPPPAETAPAPPTVAAPPAAELPSLSFDDGARAVDSSSPAVLYKNLIEYTLRANWDRPTDRTDTNYSAEVEIVVDSSGRITGQEWKSGSGDQRWDDSVRKAITSTSSINRPPPAGFPGKVLVRFDVTASQTEVFE